MRASATLTAWLDSVVDDYEDRILPVTLAVCERWARITVPDPLPTVDGLLAGTAIEHDLVLATRNVADVEGTGVAVVNPFAIGGPTEPGRHEKLEQFQLTAGQE